MRWMLCCLAVLWSAGVYSEVANQLYPLNTAAQTAQFNHLLKELRCLVCQNQDLADSNAPLAKDLREKVYLMVSDNQSDQDIIAFLTQRYGDFILFNPPMKPITYVLWSGPFVFIAIGLLIFIFTCRKRGASV